MFKKSRIKIVALVMTLLVAVMAGTVAVIYFTTYAKLSRQNRDMLELYAAMYVENGMPDAGPEGIGDHRFTVSTFYSVAFDGDGQVLELNHDAVSQMSDDELIAFAAALCTRRAAFGTQRSIVYLVTETESFTLVSMMDNTVQDESTRALLHYTVVFGAVSAVILLLLSLVLSKWIIQPLELSYQKQKQFISDAGHELKTPISTIGANAELLSRDVGENPWLSNIQYENERMSALVHQLLNLARLETVSAPQEKLDLSRIVLAGILPFEGIAFERGLGLEYDVAEGVFLCGNGAQLGELTAVLIDNALGHSDPAGTVHVSLRAEHGHALLTVANQGPEIPRSERDRIFDRFYRMDAARSEDAQHYGLGLAIAKAIVLSHHGRITVSCGDGVTRFTAVLPVRL